MIVVLVLVVVGVVVWRARASKTRTSQLDANQAAQQIASPYSALYARRPAAGVRGAMAERFLNKGGKF